MAAPTFVQAVAPTISSGNTGTAVIPGVTAGNTIYVTVSHTGSLACTFSCADDNGNTYAEARKYIGATNRQAIIFIARNATAGTTTATVTCSSGSTVFYTGAIEGTPINSATPSASAEFENATSTNTHYAAPSGQLDTGTDVFVVVVGAHPTNAGALTPLAGEGFTKVSGTAERSYVAYLSSAAALTGVRGEWSSGTARAETAIIAAFDAPTGGGPTGSPWYAFAQQ